MTTDVFVKAHAYRERAEQMARKAETAHIDELRRSYLILAREWHKMAEELLRAESPPLVPRQPEV